MGSREKFLALMIDKLDLDYSLQNLDTIDGRKFFQKVTYLVQEPINAITTEPIPLNYHYNLYLHGPYSPELADSGYELLNSLEDYNNYQKHFRLKPKHAERIGEVSGFIKKAKETLGLEETIGVLELLATVHFLYSKSYSYIDDGANRRSEAAQRCIELKPTFRKEVCEKALSLMFNN